MARFLAPTRTDSMNKPLWASSTDSLTQKHDSFKNRISRFRSGDNCACVRWRLCSFRRERSQVADMFTKHFKRVKSGILKYTNPKIVFISSRQVLFRFISPPAQKKPLFQRLVTFVMEMSVTVRTLFTFLTSKKGFFFYQWTQNDWLTIISVWLLLFYFFI